MRKKTKGMSLMSVMVATALSAVVGLMVIRLMTNQAEALQIVELREKREHLLQHYRELIISEWDRSGGNVTAKANRRFQDKDMYKSNNDPLGWWVVSTRLESTQSGWIQHSDAYNASGTDTASGLKQEDIKVVRLRVAFDPEKHPVLNIKLALREEYIYIGKRHARSQDCRTGNELTRLDTRGTTSKKLYHTDSDGAVVSYSLHSNYVKCSQVPLIENQNECPPVSGWLGFESRGTGASDNPFYRRAHGTDEYVTGRIACSYPDSSNSSSKGAKWLTAISAKGGPWYRLGRTLKDDGNVGDGGDHKCYEHNNNNDGFLGLGGLSYIDKVTKVRALDTGVGGGELLCEPTLIAPQVFDHYYDGVAKKSTTVAGSTFVATTLGDYRGETAGSITQPGPLTACTRYASYNGTQSIDYENHVGRTGGYQGKHGGGLTNFVATGAGSGARTDPFDEHSNSRGVPGDRGEPGECECGNP